jgi:hypothetical protein
MDIEWRCPECWMKYKRAQAASVAPPALVEAEPARESWLGRLSPWRKKNAR